MLLEAGICTEGEAEMLEVAFASQDPKCVVVVAERGDSLIAPKPSITLPYFNIQLIQHVSYNIYTLILVCFLIRENHKCSC